MVPDHPVRQPAHDRVRLTIDRVRRQRSLVMAGRATIGPLVLEVLRKIPTSVKPEPRLAPVIQRDRHRHVLVACALDFDHRMVRVDPHLQIDLQIRAVTLSRRARDLDLGLVEIQLLAESSSSRRERIRRTTSHNCLQSPPTATHTTPQPTPRTSHSGH